MSNQNKTKMANLSTDYQFSKLSIDGFLSPEVSKKEACANGLNDWGCVMSGGNQPDNFGKGMAFLSKMLGITTTPDSLMRYADRL